MPDATTEYPIAVTNAVSALRLAGVASPYRLLLSAPLYTAVAETTGHGYPIHEHIVRVLGEDGKSFGHLHRRGGDAELPRRRLRSHLGQDASIGYLPHDADSVDLYIEESPTCQAHSPETSVVLS